MNVVAIGRGNQYGAVDGDGPSARCEVVPSRVLDSDPFESLLGLCRQLDFHYEVRHSEEFDNWTAKLSMTNWPADFYGGPGEQNKQGKYISIGHRDRLDALRSAFSMAIRDLIRNCDEWRGMAERHIPLVRDWIDRSTVRTEERERARAEKV